MRNHFFKRGRFLCCIAAATWAICGGALAEAPAPYGAKKDRPDWRWTIGAGTVVSPLYLGSNQYGVSVFPAIRVRYKDDFFASVREVGYNLVNQDGLKVGPIAKINFGRRENVKNTPFRMIGQTDDLEGLGNINTAVEAGLFAKYTVESVTLAAELRQAFFAYHGLMSDVSAKYAHQFGPCRLSVGPTLSYGSKNYMNTYFGVDAEQSRDSGLRQYDADQGIVSYGVSAALMMPINTDYSVQMFVGYKRLTAYAASSPLVQDRGSPDQVMLGVSFGYKLS